MNRRKLALLLLLSLFACIKASILSTGEDVNDFVNKYIEEHDVMIFAKSTCPHCKNSKKVLDILEKKTGMVGWNARSLYLDYMSADGPKIHAALVEKTGHTTVPNVFIAGKHVGGNAELTNMYESGELLKTIKDISMAKVKA